MISSWNAQMHRGPPLGGFPGAGRRGCGFPAGGLWVCGTPALPDLEACRGALLTGTWSWAGHLAKSLSFLIQEVGIAARRGGKRRTGPRTK